MLLHRYEYFIGAVLGSLHVSHDSHINQEPYQKREDVSVVQWTGDAEELLTLSAGDEYRQQE